MSVDRKSPGARFSFQGFTLIDPRFHEDDTKVQGFTLIDPRFHEDDTKVQGFTLIDPRFHEDDTKVQGFTLIELLIVIAIIAILAVVVVLTLNPAEMMRQARDSNRLSDLSSLQSAISPYEEDMAVGGSSASLGSSTIVYVSLPDPTLTGTSYMLTALPESQKQKTSPGNDPA